jgi:hypothetical protein
MVWVSNVYMAVFADFVRLELTRRERNAKRNGIFARLFADAAARLAGESQLAFRFQGKSFNNLLHQPVELFLFFRLFGKGVGCHEVNHRSALVSSRVLAS